VNTLRFWWCWLCQAGRGRIRRFPFRVHPDEVTAGQLSRAVAPRYRLSVACGSTSVADFDRPWPGISTPLAKILFPHVMGTAMPGCQLVGAVRWGVESH
jgi:hypothetical protein